MLNSCAWAAVSTEAYQELELTEVEAKGSSSSGIIIMLNDVHKVEMVPWRKTLQ